MKIGDYVAKITNEWQKHNKWMEFPDEKPEPLGVIVGRSQHLNGVYAFSWDVLTSGGVVVSFSQNDLKVVNG